MDHQWSSIIIISLCCKIDQNWQFWGMPHSWTTTWFIELLVVFCLGSQPWKRNNLEISRAQKEPLKHNVVSYGFWSPNTSLGFQKPPHYVSNLWGLEDWCAKLGFHNPSWIPFSNLQRVRRVHLSNLLQHSGTIGRLENPAGLQQTHLPVPQGTLGEWLVNRWVNNEQRWCTKGDALAMFLWCWKVCVRCMW